MLIITPMQVHVRNLAFSKVPYSALFSQCLCLEMRKRDVRSSSIWEIMPSIMHFLGLKVENQYVLEYVVPLFISLLASRTLKSISFQFITAFFLLCTTVPHPSVPKRC